MNISKQNNHVDELSLFKKILHGNKNTVFLAIKNERAKTESIELTGSIRKNLTKIQTLNHEGWNIFMTVNHLSTLKRKGENISRINAFFIDYDKGDWSCDDPDQLIRKFPIKPDLVIETSPGCVHAYWTVTDAPLTEFKAVQQKLASIYGSDPKVCDLPRVMRMPGTINWKRPEQFMVRIVHRNSRPSSLTFSKFLSKMLPPTNLESADAAEDCGKDTFDVSRALSQISSDDRATWITVGMALHDEFGDTGLAIYKKWSSTSSKFNEAETERQWRSFKNGGGITLKTIFWLATQASTTPSINQVSQEAPTNFLALAKLFAIYSQNRLRHSEESNSWYVAQFSKWYQSEKAATRVAIEFLQEMNLLAQKSPSDTFRSFIDRNQSAASARELLRAAESDPLLSANSKSFVQEPHLLSVRLFQVPEAIERHAVISLSEKKRKLALPADMVLNIAGATYDRNATAPLWAEFIKQITVGDEDLADFLQIAVGYTLFGHTKEQVMFILIGTGGNGKGVFLHMLHKVFGDYATAIQSSLLKPGAISANNPSPALMKLMSKRLWTCSEVPKGMILDEALTKQITGGDLLSTRQLYGEQIEFEPIGKLWLSVNNMPRVRHDDEGMWRRIIPIPFNAVFSGNARDNDLEMKLEAQLPGILNWALEGARKYAAKGKLGRPTSAKKLLSELRRDVDTVGLWIETRCLVSEDGKLQSKIAYEDYCETMKRERTNPLPQKEFNADLTGRGFLHKSSRRFNYFAGLVLRTDI